MKVYVYTRAISTAQDGWLSIDETQVSANPEDVLATFNQARETWMNDEDDTWTERWNTYGCGDSNEYSAYYSCDDDAGTYMVQSVTVHEI